MQNFSDYCIAFGVFFFPIQLIEYFRSLMNVDITCEVLQFRSGSVLADVNLTFPVDSASQAQNIMDNVGNVTAMDIGDITVGNEIYFPITVGSNGKIEFIPFHHFMVLGELSLVQMWRGKKQHFFKLIETQVYASNFLYLILNTKLSELRVGLKAVSGKQ